MAVLHLLTSSRRTPTVQSHTENTVVYTGTHDNDTTVGWGQRPLQDVLRDALASPACLASFPFRTFGARQRGTDEHPRDGRWELDVAFRMA